MLQIFSANQKKKKYQEVSRCYLHDSMRQLETIKAKVFKLIDPVQPLQKQTNKKFKK